jgi:hypothetical protein
MYGKEVIAVPDLPLKAQDGSNPPRTAGDYLLGRSLQWGAEPLRHADEDLHLGQMRSPAHPLVNGRKQARQSRTLGSMSLSAGCFSV